MNFAKIMPLFVLLLIFSGCGRQYSLRIGDIPKRVELADIHGHKVFLPDDYKGKVVMLRFWSVSCPSCNKEIIKAMEALYLKYKDNGFIPISVNVKQPPEVAEEFRKLDKSITYPVLLDPDSAIAEQYGIKGLPTTFILDRNGVVREKVIGEAGIEMFESLIPPLLTQ